MMYISMIKLVSLLFAVIQSKFITVIWTQGGNSLEQAEKNGNVIFRTRAEGREKKTFCNKITEAAVL